MSSDFISETHRCERTEQQMRDRDALARTIGDLAFDAVITCDERGTIDSFNPAAEGMFGYRADAVRGRHVRELLAESSADDFVNALAQNRADAVGTRPGKQWEGAGRRRDGSSFPVRIAFDTCPTAEAHRLACVVRDLTDTRKAEEQNHFLNDLIATSTDAILTTHPDGTISTWNRAAEKLFGDSAEAMIGRPLVTIASDDRAAELGHALAQLQQGERIENFELMRRLRNGAQVHASLTISALEISEGRTTGLVVIARDTTDQKLTESVLRASEERMRSVLLSAADAILTIDDSGVIESFNPAAERLFGYRLPEAAGRKIEELIPPDGTDRVFDNLLDPGAVDTPAGKCCGREALGRRQDGTRFPVEWTISQAQQGERSLFTVIVRDISERKLTEMMETELGRIVEESLNEVYIFDVESLRFVLANHGARANLGYTLDELRTFSPIDIKPYFSPAAFQSMIAKLVSGEVHKQSFTTYHRRKDGSEYPVEIHLQMATFRGKPAFVANAVDLTYRRQTDAALREAKEAAETANQAKSAFLANMSHEIRTPMTAILGYTDLLIEEGDLTKAPKHRVEALTTIKRNGDHLLRIINDVLDLSKIEANKLAVESVEVSPFSILEDVKGLMSQRACDRGIEFAVVCETPIPHQVNSDPTRLRQILVNLVCNAIKFTDRGSVTLFVRMASDPATRLEFDVVDTGIGMTPKQQQRLFQPFSQADSSTTRKFGGTGLGLSISKRLAQLLGGDVCVVESVVGQGTRFRVSIDTGPLDDTRMVSPSSATGETPTGLSNSDNPPPPSLTGSRILLAEDGPDNQRLIRFVLSKAGADVTVVDNGQAAVDDALAARAAGKPFDVVLMDMQMPILDGYAATSRLREEGYARPIVALTANAMGGDRDKCLAAGCDEYATKPVDWGKLVRLIRSQIDQSADRPTTEPVAPV